MIEDDVRRVLCRFKGAYSCSTQLDVYKDLIGFVRYLTSREYLAELLHTVHGVGQTELDERVAQVKSHVFLALDYLEQAQQTSSAIGFLPAYYATLNLLKAVILVGPRSSELASSRLHGVTHGNGANPSGTFRLMDEKITLKPNGTLALYLKSATGAAIVADRELRIESLYPYITDIAAEYTMSTKRGNLTASVVANEVSIAKRDHVSVKMAVDVPSSVASSVTALPAFPLFSLVTAPRFMGGRSLPGVPRDHVRLGFSGPEVAMGGDVVTVTADGTVAHLKYHPLVYGGEVETGRVVLGDAASAFPEEFVIALVLFHMSSVVRYQPELLAHFRDSNHWPMLDALKRHGLMRLLIVFWSLMHKKTMVIAS